MKVIIAGGTGFLGRHVSEALVAAGHSVLLLARGSTPDPRRPTAWSSCGRMSPPALCRSERCAAATRSST